MIAKVISGGQVGADQGALRAAKAAGVPTGGTAPKGYMTEAGPAPWLGPEYGLVESPSPHYPVRTADNVRDSGWTLWLGDPASPGGRLTARLCLRMGRPFTTIDMARVGPADCLAKLMAALRPSTVLNVAGNRESRAPGIGDSAYLFVLELLRLDRERSGRGGSAPPAAGSKS